MHRRPFQFCLPPAALLLAALAGASAQSSTPVVFATNVNVRVVGANVSSGNFQRYEAPGLRILQGLRPDVVAIQEFNYASTNGAGVNTPAAIREMIDASFGASFHYFREYGYSIPNGIISRWPILAAGSWDDVQLPDRGFAWAHLDTPGTNDLYVVSVHLHSGGGPSSRAIEATNLTALIQSNFPAGAFVVLAGDFNTDSRSESALTTFKTFLSDSPIPTDAVSGGDPDTNLSRAKPYDYVLPGFSLAGQQVPVVLGNKTFANGLVFDSRTNSPLGEVSPVLAGDSGVSGMQHMAVVKDFRFSVLVTNFVAVPAPVVRMTSTSVLRWTGLSNLAYTVQSSTELTNWIQAGSATSATTNYVFTNFPSLGSRQFFRVVWP